MPHLLRPGQLLRRQHRANLQGHLKRLPGEQAAELPDLGATSSAQVPLILIDESPRVLLPGDAFQRGSL